MCYNMIKKVKPDKRTYLAHGLWFAESRQLEWGTDLKRNFRRMKASGQGQGLACPLLKTELRAGLQLCQRRLSITWFCFYMQIPFPSFLDQTLRGG